MSPDGQRLATIAYDRTARLWDLTSGAAVYTFTDVYTSPAPLIIGGQWIDVAFSPDGAKLATAGGSSVKVWNAATGDELVSLPPAPQPIAFTVAFSPGGNHLAVGIGRGSGVWDVVTGEKLFELAGHTAAVAAVVYSADGRQIATSSVDGTIRLWDADTGAPQITLQDQAFFLAFSPDDTRLAAQGADGILRLYALRLEDLMAIASARLTRWWTPEECRQYLHVDVCPARP
jgi:WD40 repeat protein